MNIAPQFLLSSVAIWNKKESVELKTQTTTKFTRHAKLEAQEPLRLCVLLWLTINEFKLAFLSPRGARDLLYGAREACDWWVLRSVVTVKAWSKTKVAMSTFLRLSYLHSGILTLKGHMSVSGQHALLFSYFIVVFLCFRDFSFVFITSQIVLYLWCYTMMILFEWWLKI